MSVTESHFEILKDFEIPLESIKQYYRRFKALDTDGDDFLTTDDLLEDPYISENPLAKRIVNFLDTDKDGKISFVDFLAGIAKLSDLDSNEKKTLLLFSIYDCEGDDFISNGDLFSVLKMMVGSNLNDIQLQQLVDRSLIKADLDQDALISAGEFDTMLQNYSLGDKN